MASDIERLLLEGEGSDAARILDALHHLNGAASYEELVQRLPWRSMGEVLDALDLLQRIRLVGATEELSDGISDSTVRYFVRGGEVEDEFIAAHEPDELRPEVLGEPHPAAAQLTKMLAKTRSLSALLSESSLAGGPAADCCEAIRQQALSWAVKSAASAALDRGR